MINAKVELLFDEEEINGNRDTSHTINSGRGGKCSRTNTPRKGRNGERTEEIGGRRQQSKQVFIGTTGCHRESRQPVDNRGAMLIHSVEKFRPVVSLNHDYSGRHQGRLMYSVDSEVPKIEEKNIIRETSEISHRFRGIHSSGKSPKVSRIKEDNMRSDYSDSVEDYRLESNNNVSSSSQIAPIQMDVKRFSTGKINSIHPDQHIPLRSARGECKGSESQEEEGFRCVVPEDTTNNKFFPRERRQISDRIIGRSHNQPSNMHQHKGNRIYVNEMEATDYDYNDGVAPISTEKFYGSPIRYNFADGHKLGWPEVATGKGVVKQKNRRGHWMSVTTNEDDNSRHGYGYDSRLNLNVGKVQSREGNWVTDYVVKSGHADHRKAGNTEEINTLESTPSFAGVGTVSQPVTHWTMEPRSTEGWGNRGVNNPRWSHNIEEKGRSRGGDWVSGCITKPGCIVHKKTGTTKRDNIQNSNLAGVDKVTHQTTERTQEPRSTIRGYREVDNCRLSNGSSTKGQSERENWVSEHITKLSHADHQEECDINRHILRSTPNFGDDGTVTRAAISVTNSRLDADVTRSRGANESRLYKNHQLKRKSYSVDDIIDWVEVQPQMESKGKCEVHANTNTTITRTGPQKVIVQEMIIKPRMIRSSTEGTLNSTKQPAEEPLKRTSVSVLREVLGGNGPRWMRLNTDRIKSNQTSAVEVETRRRLNSSNSARNETIPMKEIKLNSRAQCFIPGRHRPRTTVEVTMTAEIDDRDLEKEDNVGEGKQSTDPTREQVETPKPEKPPMVWNLKGRSIDDILRDLEELKNDPDIPMPIIEADLAPAEDFEQYTKTLNKEDCVNGTEEEDEFNKDSGCLETLQHLTGPGLEEFRPQAFPAELWPYVFNGQKTLVKERWNGYDEKSLPTLVNDFLTELKVSDERPYAKPYFIAQALANLDRFVIKSREGIPPLINEKFTQKMELLPGTRIRKELPQRFSENQTSFLRAKLAILEEQGRIKQKDGMKKEDWLHRLVLVENPTRMAAFRLKYGDKTQQAMNDPGNRYEVSQLYRLTIDCREINKCLVVEPYPMPDNSMGKEHIIGSRYMSTSDAADAFYAVPIREVDYGKTGFTALGKQWVRAG